MTSREEAERWRASHARAPLRKGGFRLPPPPTVTDPSPGDLERTDHRGVIARAQKVELLAYGALCEAVNAKQFGQLPFWLRGHLLASRSRLATERFVAEVEQETAALVCPTEAEGIAARVVDAIRPRLADQGEEVSILQTVRQRLRLAAEAHAQDAERTRNAADDARIQAEDTRRHQEAAPRYEVELIESDERRCMERVEHLTGLLSRQTKGLDEIKTALRDEPRALEDQANKTESEVIEARSFLEVPKDTADRLNRLWALRTLWPKRQAVLTREIARLESGASETRQALTVAEAELSAVQAKLEKALTA